MKRVYTVLLFVALCPLNLFSQCYNLVWSDEFDGPDLDLNNWNYNIGDGCPDLCGWGNGELQYYTNSTDNVYIDNGVLVLEAIKENVGSSEFSSGKVDTKGKHEFTYGRFEARMRMPQGYGLWPAFWMLRPVTNWPMTGEIDIMEYRGDHTNKIDGTLHYGSSWPNNQWDGTDYYLPSGNFYSDFHEFAVEWDSNSITWFVDDIVFKTETKDPNSLNPQSTDDPWPWDTDFYLILNLAVGGWYSGTTDPYAVQLTKPTFEIDYVRVYEMTGGSTTQTPYGGTPATIPGTIQAEDYDESCAGYGWYDTGNGNNGGEYRSDWVDIEATTDVGGGYNIGWTADDEWLEYTVDVTTTGNYDLIIRAASDDWDGGAVRLEVDDVDVTGTITINNTGDWQNWENFIHQDISLSAGQHILKLYIENNNVNINYFTLTDDPVDCNGDPGGTAYFDNCGTCVDGNTGEVACTQDCNGDWGGTAYLDNCSDCVGGNTGEVACTQDCDGDWGGTAYVDNCSSCVEGNTGETACSQDCNGDWGGTATLDVCNQCAGGNTGVTPETNIDNCVSALDDGTFDGLLIYPNPSYNAFKITGSEQIDSYKIIDLNGKTIESGANRNYSELSIGIDLAPGIYILELRGNNTSGSFRIVKF